MHRNSDFARFIISLLPNATKRGPEFVHGTLVAFNAATLHDFISRTGHSNKRDALDESLVVQLVDALLVPLTCMRNSPGATARPMGESIVRALLFSFSEDVFDSAVIARILHPPLHPLRPCPSEA
jgi:hypothetical protein